MKSSLGLLEAKQSLLREKIVSFQKTKEFQEYQRWRTLSKEEQQKIRDAWREYYRVCRSSFWGKAFQFLSEKMKNGESVKIWAGKVREKAEERGETIRVLKPSPIDPEELEQKLSRYLVLCGEFQRVSAMIEEEKRKHKQETLE